MFVRRIERRRGRWSDAAIPQYRALMNEIAHHSARLVGTHLSSSLWRSFVSSAAKCFLFHCTILVVFFDVIPAYLVDIRMYIVTNVRCRCVVFVFRSALYQRSRVVLWSCSGGSTGWRRKKTGPPSHCKYSEIQWPNCVEIGELLQYYMLDTVINFFLNFIALWRHLAKTQIVSFIHTVQIDLSITQ